MEAFGHVEGLWTVLGKHFKCVMVAGHFCRSFSTWFRCETSFKHDVPSILSPPVRKV